MKQSIIKILKNIAKPLLGKGIIDRHFPFLLRGFEIFYGFMQGNQTKIVAIPLDSKLKIYSGDIGMGLPLILKGAYEKETTKQFISKVKQKETIFDIGANAGYYTILASKAVGNSGNVFSFEPDPKNYDLLKENISLNNLNNVKAFRKALSNKTGDAFFESKKFNRGDSSLSESGEITIPTTTLDAFTSEINLKRANLIIVDIEGAEIDALNGGKIFFSNCTNLTLIIEYNPSSLYRFGFKGEDLIKTLQSLQFEITEIIDDQKQTTIPYSEENLRKIMSHTTFCNLICSK